MTTIRLFYKENSAKDKTYIDAAYNGINKFLDDFLPIVTSDNYKLQTQRQMEFSKA